MVTFAGKTEKIYFLSSSLNLLRSVIFLQFLHFRHLGMVDYVDHAVLRNPPALP